MSRPLMMTWGIAAVDPAEPKQWHVNEGLSLLATATATVKPAINTAAGPKRNNRGTGRKSKRTATTSAATAAIPTRRRRAAEARPNISSPFTNAANASRDRSLDQMAMPKTRPSAAETRTLITA